MHEEEPTDDLALLAVIDAYKFWINCDFGFLQLTQILDASGARSDRKTGIYDRDTLRQIAHAYKVSRNIPAHDNDRQADKVVEILNSVASKNARGRFAKRAKGLAEIVENNQVIFAAKEKKNKKQTKVEAAPEVQPAPEKTTEERQLASAYSKLTWFLRPEDWTIFDRFVGMAICGSSQAGLKQMNKYYERLGLAWPQTSSALADASEKHGFNRLMGFRIVDKWLYLHGVSMSGKTIDDNGEPSGKPNKKASLADRLMHPSIQSSRKSLLATKQVLPPCVGERLDDLAKAAQGILVGSGWMKEPLSGRWPRAARVKRTPKGR